MDIVELRSNNLYSNGRIIEFSDGESILDRDLIEYDGSPGDEYHTVVEGDSLDGIAQKRYGRLVEDASKYWWVIADVNHILNPLDIEEWIGQELLIPDIFRIKLIINASE